MSYLTIMGTGKCLHTNVQFAKIFFPNIKLLNLSLRSPIADPKSKGMVCGFTLDTSEKQLALLYLATVQGIAYGTRHIVEHCNAHGHNVRIQTLTLKCLFEIRHLSYPLKTFLYTHTL